MRASDRSSTVAIAEVVLVAASLRVVITTVGPLVAAIRADLGLSNTALGLLTAMPLLAFALFSTPVAALANRVGNGRVLAGAMALVASGVLLRSAGTAAAAMLGTALLGVGITGGNVLLPGVVKRRFPRRSGLMTSVYVTVMTAFAGLGAALSVILADGLGLGWQGALACWALLPALALLLLRLPGATVGRARVRAAAPAAMPWRSTIAWQVTIFMGAQSLVFYTLVAWLPALLQADGVTAESAGYTLGIMQLAGLVATMAVPTMAARRRSQRRLAIASSMLCVGGFAGLLTAAAALAVPAAILLGLGTGAAFSLSLTLFILRSPDVAHTAALSGMAQSVGYAIAALGPIGLGALHDATGDWTLPLVALVGVGGVMVVAGTGAGRDRVLPVVPRKQTSGEAARARYGGGMEKPSESRPGDEQRGEHNELGYYNADEDATYNERGGTQGEPPGDELAEEITDKP